MYKIGIDIGGTKINTGLFDSVTKQMIAYKKSYISEVSGLTEHIKGVVSELCSENGINADDVISCGIGVPGTVSSDGRKILKTPNLDILNERTAEMWEREMKVPIGFVQDSRAAAWGEYLCGGGKGAETLVCVTLGTGIGVGIVSDGEIYNGALGCAGELGHIPAVEGGRMCGCGKRGCLEKYCAGGGLDITARELFGANSNAGELFDAAENGNARAKEEIENAVKLLGKGLVSAVNLMSPDRLLISGGLIARDKMYTEPVIEYVKAHCYNADKIPEIKKAELGELSPLYGAAFISVRDKRRAMLSASIMCADILNMKSALAEIKAAGIEYLHCDIMDNHFVPNLMMPTEFLNKLRPETDVPFDFHIMAENPESIIEKLDIKSGDTVSVHYESTVHLQRAITMIKERGAKPAVAINPATPLCVLDEILPQLDMLLIMSVNPGFAGQKLVYSSIEKIRKAKKMIEERGLEHILIQVDGNCSFENVPKMYEAGADIFVVGTSSVFKRGQSVAEGTKRLRALISETER